MSESPHALIHPFHVWFLTGLNVKMLTIVDDRQQWTSDVTRSHILWPQENLKIVRICVM